MEKTEIKTPTKLEFVLPRTLVPKTGHHWDASADIQFDVTHVWGGVDENVLCATFLDPEEAQAWIIASCHFGRPVQGYKYGAGVQSGEQPEETGGSDERSV